MRREERWARRATSWWLARAVSPIVLIAIVFFIIPAIEYERTDRQVASLLRQGGIETRGKPIQFTFKVGPAAEFFFTESVQVEFETADGKRVAPWIPTVHAGQKDALPLHLPPGADEDDVAVRYLRTDPSVARLVRDPEPRVGQWQFDVVVLAVIVGVVVRASLKRRRVLRAKLSLE